MAHCKAPMRAIFILVFTAVQANALAPRGLATPPDITQSVRRVVRRLGHSMSKVINARRATEGKTIDGHGCCLEKKGSPGETEVYTVHTAETCQNLEQPHDKVVPLPETAKCQLTLRALDHLLEGTTYCKEKVATGDIMKRYFQLRTKQGGTAGDEFTAKHAVQMFCRDELVEDKRQVENAKIKTKSALEIGEETIKKYEATIKEAQAELDKIKADYPRIEGMEKKLRDEAKHPNESGTATMA